MTPVVHTASIEQVCRELQCEPEGLSSQGAARRLAEHGPNELEAARSISPWRVLASQLANELIVILLIATVLSALLGHAVEAIAIAVIVGFAVVLGFVQEYRAERAIAALHEMAAPTARVMRDGVRMSIPARELVPGDRVLLATGDRVPADLRLDELANLKINEAALTGESVAVAKQVGVLADPDLAIGDRSNMAFSGTDVTYGRGGGLVVATGKATEFGAITELLSSVAVNRTPLQDNLDRVGRWLTVVAIAIVLVIVGLGVARGAPLLEMFIFGVALAVAVVPEALPAVVTVSLAIGVQRMVRRRALIRHLPTVETLGSTSVICADKTGTLTRDEMTVRRLWVAGTWIDVSGRGYVPDGSFDPEPDGTVRELLRAGLLASDARLALVEHRWEIAGDPTEGALVVVAAKAGLDQATQAALYPRVGEIPFTSESRCMTTMHHGPEGPIAYSKGAPEVIAAHCDRIAIGGAQQISDQHRAQISAAAEAMATSALRVLAVAYKPDATLADAEQAMIFLGLVGMIDPPRTEVARAVATCVEAGIKPVMITGDHPQTAEAIARELGILRGGRVVTGAELDRMSDDELAGTVADIDVYARVSPAHKLRVVTAWQVRGHVVAMTGDGVNDAPALKKADIGIAMGITGTDVSKAAADMTLTDDDFASIVGAVEEGRGIFTNIKKYLMYLLSSNIGEVGLMAGAAIAGWPLPLTAVQILYVNLATDGLPALALAVDPPDDDLMRRRPRDRAQGIFTPAVVLLMLVGGMWSTLVNLSLFGWALQSGRGLTEASREEATRHEQATPSSRWSRSSSSRPTIFAPTSARCSIDRWPTSGSIGRSPGSSVCCARSFICRCCSRHSRPMVYRPWTG